MFAPLTHEILAAPLFVLVAKGQTLLVLPCHASKERDVSAAREER